MSSRLFIAIPTYGGLPAGAVGSLLKLVKCNALPMKLRTRDNDSAVCRARNYLTADFLESDCEKLLFIDSDIMFDPEQVRRIASHDEDVVGGFYPIKNDDPIVTWCVNHQKDGDGRPDSRGLIPVKYIGTGFLCIHRRVFEQIAAAGLAPQYRSEYAPHRIEREFWHMGVRVSDDYPDGRFLSEDWEFCQRCLDLGIPVWGDSAVFLKHFGQAVWPLPLQKQGIEPIGQNDAADTAGAGSGLINRIPPPVPTK